MEDRGSNGVTLVVEVGCGSCFDVDVAPGAVCIVGTSGMLGHRVFTLGHAHLSIVVLGLFQQS